MKYILTNELIRNAVKNSISEQPSNLEFKKKREEYRQAVNEDFEKSWAQKKFKWFFPKRRKKKLLREVRYRYIDLDPIFDLIAETVNEVLPQTLNESFGQLVDIKNVERPTCEFCGSTDTKVETAVSLSDPLCIKKFHHIKCCNWERF